MHACKLSYPDVKREDTEQSADTQVIMLYITPHNGTS